MIKLSIIVPVYNVEEYLEECLDSLLNQTLKNIEIIIVNDGSTDDSSNIIKNYKDKRIKVINKKNGGLSSARNEGMKIATGEYLAFVDSDDYICKNTAYEEMCNIADSENVDVVSGNAIYYFSKDKNYPMNLDSIFKSKKVFNSDEFLINSINTRRIYTPVWLYVYRRSLLVDNNIFYKNGILEEDELFSPQVFLRAKKVAIYLEDFYIYRQREGSIMNSGFNIKRGYDVIDTCIDLDKIYFNIKNGELKKVLCNNIAEKMLYTAYEYKIKDISIESKKLIKRNAYSKVLKVKAALLNINTNLFFKLEDLNRKLRRI